MTRLIRPLALVVLVAGAASCDPTQLEGEGVYTWGTVRDFVGGGPLEGVDVCVHQSENCTESDGDGAFILEQLPENEDFAVSFDDTRFFLAVGMYNTSRAVEFDWKFLMSTEDAMALQVSLAGDELEPGKGHIFFAAAQETGHDKPGVPGVTLTPAAGSEGLGQVVYGNDLGVPEVERTDTGARGAAIFANVEPGVYEFEVGGRTCEPYFSWNSPDGVTYGVEVFANTLSTVTVVCDCPDC